MSNGHIERRKTITNDRFKFRVWFDGRFIYKSLCDSNVYTEDDKCICLANTLPDLPWEQCTGLKDKNGKLIYEGDFLDYKGEVCLVFWSEPTACFGVMLQDSGYTDYAGDIKRSDLYSIDAEIIGNIHENPELLKESK